MRLTFGTFAIGMMALAGVPFLFSGFWSKEGILHAAAAWGPSPLPFWAALLGVVLTAFYMTRLIAEVFFGQPRSGEAAHAHESPAVMTVPLVLLAAGSIGLGFLGTPAWPWIQSRLSGVEVPARPLSEGAGLTVVSTLLVAFGIGAGWALYARRPRTQAADADPLEAAAPGAFAALRTRLGFDELYAATVGRAAGWLAAGADVLDRRLWDGVVRLLGRLGEAAGAFSRGTDEAGINAGFDEASGGLRAAGRAYAFIQRGHVTGYLRTVVLGFLVLALFAIWGGGR